MSLSNEQKKALRSIGHNLKPIVSIAGKGLTEGVMDELDRALNDHELIKIKISVGDRKVRDQVLDQLLNATQATLVQQIGHTALLLRKNPKAKPKLSNIQ
ncbi:MAG: YhbY family RNA-binding protein [Oceanobacter sp.]|jgi:RNA-binding protein